MSQQNRGGSIHLARKKKRCDSLRQSETTHLRLAAAANHPGPDRSSISRAPNQRQGHTPRSPRSLTNAIFFPSGDHFGCELLPRAKVSALALALASLVPKIGAIQICFFADHTANSPFGDIWMSSHPSSSQPMSPSKRGSPLSTSAAHTCCMRFSTLLVGSAISPALFASLPRA